MTPQQFGQLALQLLAAAQIPGEALDAAMQFRGIAQDLASGRTTFAPADLPISERELNQV